VKPEPRRRHLIPVLLAMLVLAWLPQIASAEDQATQQSGTATETATALTPRANLPDLEDEVMCPICGTLLGLSRAPAAERQRVFMRKLIAEGKDGQEIKDALVVEYGPQVLALPDDDSINFFVYLVPLAGLILAALGVLWAAVRWRRNRDPDRPAGSEGEHPGPSGTESSRLDRDLADFDR
jgi:cytochrome c-type biogenesis protein CcmH